MKNTTLFAGIVLVSLIVGAFIFVSAGKTNTTVNAVAVPSSGDVQKVTLGIKNLNYYPNTITVKAGIPVELTLDSSVQGCLRAFTIPEFNVEEYSANPSQKITFTLTKKGTFRFACSMGMGYGTIIVE